MATNSIIKDDKKIFAFLLPTLKTVATNAFKAKPVDGQGLDLDFFLPVFHEEYEAENHWDEEDFETVFDVDDDEMMKMITKHCSVLCHHI